MRLFVAAVLPEELTCALAETSALLREAVRGRYVGPDLFHVTLAFLGEVDAWHLEDACEALAAACAGTRPIEVTLGAYGSFGRSSQATLWQGFATGGREMGELAHAVRSRLKGAGLTFDAKGFLAHVTLMRRADLTAGILPQPEVASGTVRRVALVRSDLSGPRPVYEELASFELGAS